ncbi:MAG: UDP-N-acetyl-D-mannosamine dehydrogenase [Acetobacteraceae bacterium]|nr:UDP-N-acetyl-D-mannosamine dehydrogenase [Acetobacteraceae bacterium]
MTEACVVGLGYIGLPTAAYMARTGIRVHGVDIDPTVVTTVNEGRIHIVEPDLDGLVQKVVRDGALTAHPAPVPADVFLIAVPTPLGPDHAPVVDFVHAAARAIAPVLRPGNIVILESTSPVGTTAEVARLLAAARPDLSIATGEGKAEEIAVAYCPERVLPGRILVELVENDRCVGGLTPDCAERAARFYESFVRGAVLRTTAATAELVKLTENSFRDVNIAFANELSLVCDRLGPDVWEVISLANRHPRVNILRPGPGVGGHCIAVDPWFIVHSAPEQARIIRTAREVNDGKARHVEEQIARLAEAEPDAPVICFGLAFKANVDDLRESPALEITERLARRFPGRVMAVEPFVAALPRDLAALGVSLLGFEEALQRDGIWALLVDHSIFARVAPAQRQGRRIVDTRGIWPGGAG